MFWACHKPETGYPSERSAAIFVGHGALVEFLGGAEQRETRVRS
jgi:hypothetical protein